MWGRVTDSSPTLGRLLPADRFHTGVRLAILGVWLGAIVLAYLVVGFVASQILGPLSGLSIFLVLVAAIIVAQPLAWLGERQLLARWPSGRAAQLAPGALVWRDRGPTSRLDLGQKVNYWRWRFSVRRRRGGRVPSNHQCFAIRLVQSDTVVTLYTFLPPAAADTVSARYPFYELRRPTETSKASLGGRDAIFMAAEHTRWEEGAELEPADFDSLLAHLAAHLPEFPRSAQSGV
jgi:hypothetical protein